MMSATLASILVSWLAAEVKACAVVRAWVAPPISAANALVSGAATSMPSSATPPAKAESLRVLAQIGRGADGTGRKVMTQRW